MGRRKAHASRHVAATEVRVRRQEPLELVEHEDVDLPRPVEKRPVNSRGVPSKAQNAFSLMTKRKSNSFVIFGNAFKTTNSCFLCKSPHVSSRILRIACILSRSALDLVLNCTKIAKFGLLSLRSQPLIHHLVFVAFGCGPTSRRECRV